MIPPEPELLTEEQMLEELYKSASGIVADATRHRYAADKSLPIHAIRVSLKLVPVTIRMWKRIP